MKKILVPTDFTSDAAKAYPVARNLAATLEADIILFHIVPSDMQEISVFAGGTYPYYTEANKSVQEEIEESKQGFQGVLDSGVFAGVNVETLTLENEKDNVVESVLDFLNNKEHKYLVLGTAGSDEPGESNAELIARKASIPVISVHREVAGTFEKVLLPTDFRTIDKHFINDLMEIVDQGSTQLEVLYVNTPKHFMETEEIEKEWTRFAKKFDLPAHVTLAIYNAYKIEDAILRYAEKHKFSLIALPTHGRTGIERFFHHSYTEDIINESSIPVYSYNMHNDYHPARMVSSGNYASRGFVG